MDVRKLLYKQLIRTELSKSKKNGCTLQIPFHAFGEEKSSDSLNQMQKKMGINLPETLLDFYQKVEYVEIKWTLFEEEGDARDNTDQFKNHEWLRENYLDNGYAWSFVKEYLSGSIFISSVEKLLNQDPQNSYYAVLEAMGLNPQEYRLFDAQSRATALLRVENNMIVDNIWIIDLDSRELYDMKVGIEEYLNLGYKAKLFNAWQLVYILGQKIEFYELMKRYLPMIAPHLDLDLESFGI